VNEQVLANFLKNEYPQTVAVILGKIGQAHAGKVLSILPENFAMEVVMRMLRMEAVNKEIEKDVERVLRTEFMSNLARTNRRDAHEMMAEIFNNLDRATESRFLSALEERNKDSAEKIRSLMFTLEDLARIDPAGVQTLLRAVDKDKLTIALTRSPPSTLVSRRSVESMEPTREPVEETCSANSTNSRSTMLELTVPSPAMT
jgi:flagellar motor switch protein FliG